MFERIDSQYAIKEKLIMPLSSLPWGRQYSVYNRSPSPSTFRGASSDKTRTRASYPILDHSPIFHDNVILGMEMTGMLRRVL